jgi:hypothetical protein
MHGQEARDDGRRNIAVPCHVAGGVSPRVIIATFWAINSPGIIVGYFEGWWLASLHSLSPVRQP